jgi:SSS family solute:Na+ symporter
MFWNRTTPKGALAAAIGSFLASLAFKLVWPALPFLDRMNFVSVICFILAVSVSLMVKEESDQVHAMEKADFHTSKSYNLVGVAVLIVLSVIYISWW